ncbi:MAG TPA: trypsin-like peptidase domain-containing protein [Streptosporangiaceae bacterium]|nr:trypsin-like peptidase domain-containing protein [Streptosporangiaceae bacterium]
MSWPPPYEPPTRPRAGGAIATFLMLVIIGIFAVVLARPLLQRNSPVTSGVPVDGGGTVPSGRRPGVVNIDTELGFSNALAAGTGIVLSSSGTVLTNNHVIQGATRIRVTDTDNGRTYTAHVVGYAKSGDVAVLRLVGASHLKVAALAASARVREGDTVTAVGNAGGKGGAPSVVTGFITALDQGITARDSSNGSSEKLTGLLQTNAPIQPGDSGGPLLNTAGQVIGIDTAASTDFRFQQGTGEGFAIPTDQALPIVRQILAGTSSATVHIGPTALLGVQVSSASAGSGASVAGVYPNTPAEQAGVLPGAVISSLDGRPVDSPGTLTDLLLAHHPGDVVRLGWTDSLNQPHTANLSLGDGPAQ